MIRSGFIVKSLKMLSGLALGVSLMAAGVASAQSQLPPDELVKKLSTDVLDKIRTDKDIVAGNFKKLSDFVDLTVMPNVNFEKMTAIAVGRSWRQATPEQKKQLQTEFRSLILRTYSSALTEVKDESIRMKPMRGEPADTDVVVRSEIVRKRGEPIQLDYRLEKSPSGWKIYDVNVIGVWMLESYRSQFSQEITSKGLDGFIAALVEKNKKLDQAK